MIQRNSGEYKYFAYIANSNIYDINEYFRLFCNSKSLE